MKNLFSKNTQTGEAEYKRFITKQPPLELTNKIADTETRKKFVQTSNRPPLILSIIEIIACVVSLCTMYVFFDLLETKTFTETLQQYGWLFYTFITSTVFYLFFILFTAIKYRPNIEGLKACSDEKDALYQKLTEYLGAPTYAESIDVLHRNYKLSGGKAKYQKYSVSYIKFFKDNGNLCFATDGGLVTIPLDGIKSITKINKGIIPYYRNEDDMRRKDREISNNASLKLAFGLIRIKPYYSVKILNLGEEYEILLPQYEIEKFLKYVNIGVSA